MFITALIGILSSTVAEIANALNKKLLGTPFRGQAAFLIAFGIAFLGAIVKEVATPGFMLVDFLHVQTLISDFGQIFTVSQVYFLLVVEKLNLDVQATPAPLPSPQNVQVGS